MSSFPSLHIPGSTFSFSRFSLQLTSQQLNDAIKNMHTKGQYKQMVVYIEACESGSMFDNILAADINGKYTTIMLPRSSMMCSLISVLQLTL